MTESLVSLLAGGLVGFLSSAGTQWLTHSWGMRQRTRSVAGAFAGEIGALCALADRRQYLDRSKQLLEHVRTNGTLNRVVIPVTQQYMQIYERNSESLGRLPPDLALDVVRFYTQTKSLLEDVRAEARNPATPQEAEHMLVELIALLEDTLLIGNSLVPKLRRLAGVNNDSQPGATPSL